MHYRWIIPAGCILALLIIGERVAVSKISNRLTLYAFQRDYEAYQRLRKKWYTLYLFHPFNLAYMDLNVALFKGDLKEIENCFLQFDQMHLNKKQKETVYRKAFYYNVMKNEKENAEHYYHMLKDMEQPQRMQDIEIFYDTFIHSGYRFMDEVQQALKKCSKEYRADYESILAKMYENKGDLQSADEYQKLAESHFEELKQNQRRKGGTICETKRFSW